MILKITVDSLQPALPFQSMLYDLRIFSSYIQWLTIKAINCKVDAGSVAGSPSLPAWKVAMKPWSQHLQVPST